MRKFEPLHRGINTIRVPMLLEEGELQHANGARYHPHDEAIYLAEGRKIVGPAISGQPAGGHGGVGNVRGLAGLVWDPNTVVVPGVAEPYQLLYSDNGAIKTIPATSDPTHPSAASINARTWNGVGGYGPFEAVSYANEWFVLGESGGALWMKRRSTGQIVGPHGLPRSVAGELSGFNASGAGVPADGTFVPRGYYFIYWTFYNSVDDIEGTAESAAFGPLSAELAASGFGHLTIPFTGVNVSGGTNYWSTTLKLWIRAANYDGLLGTPELGVVDKLRVYCGFLNDPNPTTAIASKPVLPPPWPTINRIKEVAVPTTAVVNPAYPSEGAVWYLLATLSISELGALSTKPLFDAITVNLDTDVTNASRNAPPPIATTGDVFEESLVINDLEDPRKIWFSYPNKPHSFPPLFFLNMETGKNDRVVSVRTLGRALGVFLKSSVWRVNWLPRQSDIDFARGRVKDIVCEDFGAVSTQCVTKATIPGVGAVVFWVSGRGIHFTDLDSYVTVTNRLDWKALVASPIALVNNVDEWRLEFHYTGLDGKDSILYLHYDETHVVEGNLSITGPILREGIEHATALTFDNGKSGVVVADKQHNILYEGFGTTDESSGRTVSMGVQTREMYLAGPGGEFKTSRFFVKTSTTGSLYAALLAGPTLVARIETTDAAEPLFEVDAVVGAEFVSVIFVNGAGVGVPLVGIEFEPLAEELSR